jgi:hypothetical protein
LQFTGFENRKQSFHPLDGDTCRDLVQHLDQRRVSLILSSECRSSIANISCQNQLTTRRRDHGIDVDVR